MIYAACYVLRIQINLNQTKGDFLDDKITGKGILTLSDGDKYEGTILFYK